MRGLFWSILQRQIRHHPRAKLKLSDVRRRVLSIRPDHVARHEVWRREDHSLRVETTWMFPFSIESDDIDAIRIVSEGATKLRSPDRAMLVITHYQRLLNYIVPDKVHVLAKGRIQKTGGKELALELEKSGYADFTGQAA